MSNIKTWYFNFKTSLGVGLEMNLESSQSWSWSRRNVNSNAKQFLSYFFLFLSAKETVLGMTRLTAIESNPFANYTVFDVIFKLNHKILAQSKE